MAKDWKVNIGGDSRGAEQAIANLQRSGATAASILEREFNQLGIKSALSFENQRKAADEAFKRIKSSGLATASELERAQAAYIRQLDKIDEQEFGKVKKSLDELDDAHVSAAASAGSLSSAYGAVVGAMAALGVGKFASDLYNVNAEFGRLTATLTTITGSQSLANAEFARLEEFATRTPYQLNEVVTAATRLSALNLDSSTSALESYGNTASAMGKSMVDMIEAVADASTGEFERLKEFGIKASKEGDKVIFTFRGVKTEVANNATAIQEHLLKLGKTEFAGGMNRQMDTIGGAASNLADTYDKLLRKTGETLPIKGSIQGATTALEVLTDNLDAAVAGMTALTAAAVVGNLGTISTLMRAMAGSATLIAAGSAGLVGLVGAGAYALGTAIDRTFDLSGVVEYEKEMARAAEVDKRYLEMLDKKKNSAAKAAADKEASGREAAEKAKVREKELEAIRKHNDRILDVEKKRIDKSLQQEEEHLKKITDQYQAAISAMDSIVDARKSVQDQLNNRNAADSAKNAFDVDPLNAYMNKQDELAAAEKKIDDDFGMTAEEKAKAYANLIDKAAGYNQAVMYGSAVVISGYQTEYIYQTKKEELQEKINKLIDEEEDKRFNAAVAAAEQAIDAQEKAEMYRLELENIETVLDRLNNKEINIIFKATGAEQLLAAAGMVGPPVPGRPTRPTTSVAGGEAAEKLGWVTPSKYFDSSVTGGSRTSVYSSKIDPSTGGYEYNDQDFAVGTSYVPRTGLYQLHRGEEVLTRSEVQNTQQNSTVNVTANISINAPKLSAVDQTSTGQLARTLAPEIKRILETRYVKR